MNIYHSQVAYWDVYDGSAIRELEGSKSGAINGMHISQDGKHFVTGIAYCTFIYNIGPVGNLTKISPLGIYKSSCLSLYT